MKNSQRNFTIDIIRVVAAFGVVAIHVHADTTSAISVGAFFTPLCVPFFFITSLVYFTAGLPSASPKDVLKKSLFRIAVPYLAWTIIYLLLLAGKSYLAHKEPHIVLWRSLLYGESAVQLYYLPDLIVLQIITLGVYMIINAEFANKLIGTALFLCGCTFIWIGNYYHCFGVAEDGVLVKSAFFIYCGFLLSTVVPNVRFRPFFVVIGLMLTVYAVVAIFMNVHYTILGYPISIPFGGLGLLLAAIGMPLQRLSTFWKQLSSDSYGIYLSHILFLESFEFVMSKFFPGKIHYDLMTKLTVVTGVFVLAAIFTNLCRKIPLSRQVLLGEADMYTKSSKRTKEPMAGA